MTEYAYRYEEVAYSIGLNEYGDLIPGYNLKVELREYKIIKFTPQGFWIYLDSWLDRYFITHPLFDRDKRFVLRDARKKFACLTKADALESFKARKRRQIQILEGQLEKAKRALKLAERIDHGEHQRNTPTVQGDNLSILRQP